MVGITYQSEQTGGPDYDSFMRLLDEMAHNKMNLLCLYMISLGYHDSLHDGYAWPVRNPKLTFFKDPAATNAAEQTEFLTNIIPAAADRQIEVQTMLNWGVWNPEKIAAAEPAAVRQRDREGSPLETWLYCPDCPEVWQLGLDEVTDLLSFYDHPNHTSHVFERISYANDSFCFCKHTREKYLEDTGCDLLEANGSDIRRWKAKNIGRYISDYVKHVKAMRSGLEVWAHTLGNPAWGHDPAHMKEYGIEYLMPHTFHFRQEKKVLYDTLQHLAPNRCVLHFDVRNRAPTNYNLWIKTPEIIAEAIQWIDEYPGENIVGVLFFNHNAVSEENKKAVYEGMKRWQ